MQSCPKFRVDPCPRRSGFDAFCCGSRGLNCGPEAGILASMNNLLPQCCRPHSSSSQQLSLGVSQYRT